jgi:hypothetical protein
VQIEDLSDHAGDMLRASEDEQHRASKREDAAAARYREARADHQAARNGKSLWRRILGIPSAEERHARKELAVAEQRYQQAYVRGRSVNDTVQQQAAGVQGEDALADVLSKSLSDEWRMLRGYRNRRGEADLVVVGPPGLWVIEVKNRNARLHVDGDRWRHQKIDRYGNVVDGGEATDNTGRTWGRQASDVADDLVRWLERNNQHVPIHTAVMMMHERASLGSIVAPGVDLVSTDPGDLLREMTEAPAAVESGARAAIAALIRRDHQFHN